MRALAPGVNVVIDFGLWSRDERWAFRQAGAELGAAVESVHCDLELAAGRLGGPPLTFRPACIIFDVPTPGELDGSEPVGDPPDGFADWSAWMTARWPATLPAT